jgi:hypothetical protein
MSDHDSPDIGRKRELEDFARMLCKLMDWATPRYRELLPMAEMIYHAGERRGASLMLRTCAEIHPPLLRPGLISTEAAVLAGEEQVRRPSSAEANHHPLRRG